MRPMSKGSKLLLYI